MTTTKNNEHKKLNFSSEREQSQVCLNSAEHEKNQGRKVLNVPNLRFKEFQGEWVRMRLDAFTERVMRKNKNNKSKLPLTISAQYGLVDQITFFNKVIASTDMSNYYLLKKGEFAYNKSYSSDYPWGAVKRLDNYEQGALSSLYICFAPQDNVVSDFILQYFESPKWHKGVSEIAVEGARNHGLLNVSVQDFFHTYHYVPKDKKEQIKVAELLMLLDERIATQNKIIDKLQSLIKGINQRVFMNNGINYKLGEISEIRSGYSGNQLLSKKGLKVSRIETISGHKVNLERVGYVAPFESSENYKLQVGDILFSNINSVEYIGNTAFIDKDYDLYHGMNLLRLTPNNMVVIPFYLYLLLNTNRMLNRFKTVCNKAVSQASINQTELGKTVVQIPDINAQEQICKFYQALYDRLESEKYANSLFQKQKQYLLRQMFI